MRTKNEKPEQRKQEKNKELCKEQIVCQITPTWNLQLPWIRHKP